MWTNSVRRYHIDKIINEGLLITKFMYLITCKEVEYLKKLQSTVLYLPWALLSLYKLLFYFEHLHLDNNCLFSNRNDHLIWSNSNKTFDLYVGTEFWFLF